MEVYDVIIVGGGASGLMLAGLLNSQQKILLLEKSDRCGKKILATGNGKCNLSNINVNPKNFNHEDFVTPLLNKYSANTVLNYFHSLGIITVTDEEGRVYPASKSAVTILQGLMEVVKFNQHPIIYNFNLQQLIKKENYYKVIDENNKVYSAKKIVFAIGSNASIDCGGYEQVYKILEIFQIKKTLLFPSLCSIKTKSLKKYQISGIRNDSRVSLFCGKKEIIQKSGELLFREDGLSGIVAFELSTILSRTLVTLPTAKFRLEIDFLPNFTEQEILKMIEKRKTKFHNKNLLFLLESFVHPLLAKMLALHCEYEENILTCLKRFPLEITGLSEIKNAQIMCGGIDIAQINPQTMESKNNKHMYFMGEMLDVDGDCGGFNLHFAWASAMCVANHLSEK